MDLFTTLRNNGLKQPDDADKVIDRLDKLVEAFKKFGMIKGSKLELKESGLIYRGCYEINIYPPASLNYCDVETKQEIVKPEFEINVKYAGEYTSTYLGTIFYNTRTKTYRYITCFNENSGDDMKEKRYQAKRAYKQRQFYKKLYK